MDSGNSLDPAVVPGTKKRKLLSEYSKHPSSVASRKSAANQTVEKREETAAHSRDRVARSKALKRLKRNKTWIDSTEDERKQLEADEIDRVDNRRFVQGLSGNGYIHY